jgi:hypothetical protein
VTDTATGGGTAGQLQVRNADNGLAGTGVALDRIHYVAEGYWALASPDPPLATTGAGPCLLVVVHHRATHKGGLAHIRTSNDYSQRILFDTARDTTRMLLEACRGTASSSLSGPAEFDIFLGAGREFVPGKVSGKERPALPDTHTDFPAWLHGELGFEFSIDPPIDRRQAPGFYHPLGPSAYDSGYIIYDAAHDTVWLLDIRDPTTSPAMQVTARADAPKDEATRGKTWGPHPFTGI